MNGDFLPRLFAPRGPHYQPVVDSPGQDSGKLGSFPMAPPPASPPPLRSVSTARRADDAGANDSVVPVAFARLITNLRAMKRALRLGALAVALVGVVFWFFGGPNLGWTKTRVPVAKKDPVTEIEFQEWEPRFVPGVDFVAGVLGVAGMIFAASLFCRAPRGRVLDPQNSISTVNQK